MIIASHRCNVDACINKELLHNDHQNASLSKYMRERLRIQSTTRRTILEYVCQGSKVAVDLTVEIMKLF